MIDWIGTASPANRASNVFSSIAIDPPPPTIPPPISARTSASSNRPGAKSTRPETSGTFCPQTTASRSVIGPPPVSDVADPAIGKLPETRPSTG